MKFKPLGKVDVDAEGVWSSVMSAVATTLAQSPSDSAKVDAAKQGVMAFKTVVAAGLSVTVDLCTGLVRSGIGHAPRGKMVAPGVGETTNISVEVQPGGLMVFGPQSADRGLTVSAEVPKGTARLQLMCHQQVGALAKTFLGGRPPPRVSVLASRDVKGKATLRTGSTRCPVSLVATLPPGASQTVTLRWRRPTAETARSTGGAIIDCPASAHR